MFLPIVYFCKKLFQERLGIYIMQNTMVRGGEWLLREKKIKN